MLNWLRKLIGRPAARAVRAARPTGRRGRGRSGPDLAAALLSMTGSSHGGAWVVPASDDVRGRYDLAQTTDANRKHWAAADNLSAEAANTLGVRRVLRNRIRYEIANNSYMKGMVSTLAIDTIGTGPRLQMLTGARNTNSRIEGDFAAWAKEIKLAKKMRTLRRARTESGEGFAVVFHNPKLRSPVKLDVMIVETDRVTDLGVERWNDPLWCDGIQYDPYHNPVSYRILKQHPGGPHFVGFGPSDADEYRAEFVFHYFEAERPGQRRGVPELTPSAQTGGELRRYDNATLRTAETHARLALALQTDTVPVVDGEDPEVPESMDVVELPDNGAVILPPGYKLNGVDSTQPTDTHKAFVDTKLRETARCLNMPFTIAALDSSSANLSARYLDAQIYTNCVKVERADLETEFLDWILLGHWQAEYALATGRAPRDPESWAHTWYWPSLGQHADPDKVASAQKTRLESGVSSLSDEIAESGQDWEDVFDKEARALGVTVDEYRTLIRLKRFATPNANGTPVKTDDADPAVTKALADLELAKGQQDAYGVGVRAGDITPQIEDEEHYRSVIGAPPMSAAAKAAWLAEKTRRPITLTQTPAIVSPGPVTEPPATAKPAVPSDD